MPRRGSGSHDMRVGNAGEGLSAEVFAAEKGRKRVRGAGTGNKKVRRVRTFGGKRGRLQAM